MVIREAENIRLGVFTFEDADDHDEPDEATIRKLEASAEAGDTRAMYRLGKLCLAGEHVEKDTATAVAWFRQAAEQGDPYAQYTLGKLYLQGREVPQDREEALRWLKSSAAQGNVYAQYLIDRMDEQRDPSILLAATKLLHHASRIFREQAMSTNPQGIRMDSRRRKQLLQKRLALGHKIDDHEEQMQGQQTMN
jgi:TPR repeat protein